MTRKSPSLTPMQALEMLRKKDNQIIDGFRYYLDAPQGCDDISEFFPCVIKIRGHYQWVPSGETTTDSSVWVQIW